MYRITLHIRSRGEISDIYNIYRILSRREISTEWLRRVAFVNCWQINCCKESEAVVVAVVI